MKGGLKSMEVAGTGISGSTSGILPSGLIAGSLRKQTLKVARGDSVRIFIELRGCGARGLRYRVRMNERHGLVIIESTTEPLFEAARLLLSEGIVGKIEMWDCCRTFPRMRGDIARLASMTVSEGQDGITLRRYVERIASRDFENKAPQGAETQIGRSGCVAQTSRGT